MITFLIVSVCIVFFCILYLVVYFAVHAGVQDALSADQEEELEKQADAAAPAQAEQTVANAPNTDAAAAKQ